MANKKEEKIKKKKKKGEPHFQVVYSTKAMTTENRTIETNKTVL